MTVVAICMLAIVAAQDSTSLKDEQQIREALARYPVKVRIYKDCIADPRNYQICYLKTDGTGLVWDCSRPRSMTLPNDL